MSRKGVETPEELSAMQRVKSLARSFGRRQKRFLVIELLVVAVILCVIAAINW